MSKCQFPDGLTIKPDGIHELDPCLYTEIETIHHCTVHVLKCMTCGHIEIEWEREAQDDE